MPNTHFMIDHYITAHPQQTVDEVMHIFDREHIRTVPVCDDEGKIVGIFSLRNILKELLPLAASMEDGLPNLEFIIGAAPGAAKRLKKLKNKKISELMDTEYAVAHPDTPTWEIVRLMTLHGSPVPVVDEKTRVIKALVSSQSLLHGLVEVMDQMEKSGEA
jgi:CBS-domain-containing membrane protein